MRPPAWILASLAGATVAFACVGEDPVVERPSADGDAGAADAPANEVDAATRPIDAADPDAGSRYCDGKTKPGGASDFLCADFDGEPFDQGWTGKIESDAGVMPITTVASSAPRAVAVDIESFTSNVKNERGAALTWSVTGAQTIDRVELEVALNKAMHSNVVPAQDGIVQLLRVESPNIARVSVGFTRGGNIESAAYTGYVLVVEGFDPFNYAAFKIEPAPADDAWTRVKLVANLKAGTADVLLNGIEVKGGVSIGAQSTSAVSIDVGAIATYETNAFSFRYDDVTASVFRQ